MIRYKCIRKCHYQGRIWERGSILEADNTDKVPHHFEPLHKKPAPKAPAKTQDKK